MQENKPRRIRDIAHLYLSRRERETPAPQRRFLLVTGQRRDLFPGFHVANIAAAMSLRGVAVRVFEISGVDPNAAFFLAMPPRVYLDRTTDGKGTWVSALGAVRLTLSPDDVLLPEANGKGPAVDIVHLPPPTGPDPTQGAQRLFPGDRRRDAIELDLAQGSAPGVVAYTLRPCPGSDPRATAESSIRSGVIERWRRALTDPVPVAVRDHASHLALTYDTLSECVLAWGESAKEVEPGEANPARIQRRPYRRRETQGFRSR